MNHVAPRLDRRLGYWPAPGVQSQSANPTRALSIRSLSTSIIVEQAMSSGVGFPTMRLEVQDALAAMSDRSHQEKVWGRLDPERNYYDDLTLNVNILYDCLVFPDPANAVGAVITPDEATALTKLWDTFRPVLGDLGDQPDADYLRDPRWSEVISTARDALDAMRATDAQDRR
jgi:hypothetical protein